MSLTQDKIRHIANLAKLKLTDEDVERYSKELSNIVDYIDQLNNIPEEAFSHVSLSPTVCMPLREDVVKPSLVASDDLLACSHQKIIGHQIGISNIMN